MDERKIKSYRDLEIWKLARDLVIVVHKMTLEKLPKFEMYEEESQIPRSAKSIASNIVEGHGRRRYKNDFIKFLTYALASCDETRDHIEMLFDTGSLADKTIYDDLIIRYDMPGRKINNFLQGVIAEHLAPKDQIGQQIFPDDDEGRI
ncbi:MAG: four helix bundle protein [candidate division KSB1 bacterium]|nr:four helix bundle protein [candidate division KSB1 bacterium]MDZ7365766.1 four helix bundle protein [candidate division KSB1 bacterium]MDZ7403755.1 four helix bundle protein [candidate division KSB1 bacterium]